MFFTWKCLHWFCKEFKSILIVFSHFFLNFFFLFGCIVCFWTFFMCGTIYYKFFFVLFKDSIFNKIDFLFLFLFYPWTVVFVYSEDKSTSTQVIREVYEGDESDTFENELEKALEAKAKYIIIEPQRLGDETARWILVGNCLHKTAVASGLVSIVCGAIFPDRPMLCTPFCAVSIFCTGLYTVSWNVDHCCQYQVNK